MRKQFAVFTALVALALPTFAQQQPPFREEIDVNAVLLDVIVTDAKGNQILGLGPDDFIVRENGVVQKVDSVDYFTNRRLLTAREEQAPVKVERVREDRYFIFFFDKPSDPGAFAAEMTLAREAVRDFVRNDMKETDLVAIAGHDVRLKVYTDFTGDKQQIERALDEATKFGKGLTKATAGEQPSILRAIDTKKMIGKTGTVYQALDLLADSVRSIRARKNLVLFSPGIADREENVASGGEFLLTRSRYLDPMLESLNAANVSVYGVQLQREIGASAAHQRLSEISESTGGRYFQFNTNYRNAVDQVEETNAGYYLVTYRSQHPRGKSGFQAVEVETKNPQFRVVARSGYQYGG